MRPWRCPGAAGLRWGKQLALGPDHFSGDDLRRVVDSADPTFWATRSFKEKMAEVSHLFGGRTNDTSQPAIITILRTRAAATEVSAIDASVGWPGLDSDLTGAYQTEFDALKR